MQFAHFLKHFRKLIFHRVKSLLVQQYLTVAEPGFDSFFKRVYNVYLHRCCNKYELDLAVLEHVEDLVKEHLLCSLKVVIDVFKHKK